jgi:hypothetical protein
MSALHVLGPDTSPTGMTTVALPCIHRQNAPCSLTKDSTCVPRPLQPAAGAPLPPGLGRLAGAAADAVSAVALGLALLLALPVAAILLPAALVAGPIAAIRAGILIL